MLSDYQSEVMELDDYAMTCEGRGRECASSNEHQLHNDCSEGEPLLLVMMVLFVFLRSYSYMDDLAHRLLSLSLQSFIVLKLPSTSGDIVPPMCLRVTCRYFSWCVMLDVSVDLLLLYTPFIHNCDDGYSSQIILKISH